MQQWRGLRDRGISEPDPRSQHVDDLIAFIQSKQEKGSLIHLMGDFNEPWNDSGAGISRL